MTIVSDLPPTPDPSDPSTFDSRAYALFTHLKDEFVPEVNAVADEVNTAAAQAVSAALGSVSSSGTSTTSITLPISGTVNITTQAGKSFQTGSVMRWQYTSGTTNYLIGTVTSYDINTGDLVINATSSNGTGTFTSWEGFTTLAAPVVQRPSTWGNFALLTTDAQTFTVPNGVTEIYAILSGKGGDGAAGLTNTRGGGGGGGGSLTFGIIPVSQGEVFTFSKVGTQAFLKKGTTTYFTANDGNSATNATGAAGGVAGSVASGLGITSSGATAGGNGGNGQTAAASCGGGGGASGSPTGTGGNGAASGGTIGGGGGGLGGDGSTSGTGGGAGSAASGSTPGGSGPLRGGRDWTNAFTFPLLRPCVSGASAVNAPGVGGTAVTTVDRNGGIGGGGAGTQSSNSLAGGTGGYGGGGGGGSSATSPGPGGVGGIGGGGGGGGCSASNFSAGGAGGSAGVIIFY